MARSKVKVDLVSDLEKGKLTAPEIRHVTDKLKYLGTNLKQVLSDIENFQSEFSIREKVAQADETLTFDKEEPAPEEEVVPEKPKKQVEAAEKAKEEETEEEETEEVTEESYRYNITDCKELF